MKKIVLTGGGTAGHVTPNIALLPSLREKGYDITYIGSIAGIEKQLIEEQGIPYYGIASGKLRRYIDPKNLSDPFRVIKGFGQAHKLLGKLRPDIVFSKGGFVSVPVVLAAKMRRIPVIIHESDMTPGLANKIAIPSAAKVCCNFPETVSHLPEGKAVLTGCPIRSDLLSGDAASARELCGFTAGKPVLMIIGGSSGSQRINEKVREALPKLTERYQVLHLCGKGNLEEALNGTKDYKQIEYADKSLKDLFALADVVVSRAGANAICELLALKKPNILIPLSLEASRGDQILNAKSFASQGYSFLLEEKDMTADSIVSAVEKVYRERDVYIEAMKKSPQDDAVSKIITLIEDECKAPSSRRR